MPPIYKAVGGLIYISKLDANAAPGLLTMGFRITDDSSEKWTRRFNQFKAGDEGAVAAGVRTMKAALQGSRTRSGVTLTDCARVVVVGAISSRDTVLRDGCAVWRLGEAVAGARGCEWRPDLLRKPVHNSLHTIYNAADRDAEIAGCYSSAPVGGPPGMFVITDDFCTRGTTSADIARALRAANPGWNCLGLTIAKTERVGFWGDSLNNNHIPGDLDQIWEGR